MTLWNFLREHMMKNQTQTVSEKNAVMSFEELVIYAEILAEKLRGEKCCAICCSSEMSTAMALLGCFAAGVTAVPMSIRYGDKHCKKILDMVSPTAFITDTDGTLEIYQIEDSIYKAPRTTPALIMYTSGTTGIPKGTMLTEANIITNITDIDKYFAIDKNDSILIARPLYHCAVLTGEFLTALIKGTRIVFESGEFNPMYIAKKIASEEITTMGGTPTLFSILARFCSQNRKLKLKNIVLSGECMSKETGKKIRSAFRDANIYHVYGMTEASPRISYMPPDRFDEEPDCVGIPLDSVSIKILGKDGKSVKEGGEGILWVRGENVMKGYYNANEQTQKVLKNGWLCTGDIAMITSRGWLKIKGRSDDMIIRAGMNIYPAEIEAELRKDSRTKDVLVYEFKDEKKDAQIAMKISGEFSKTDEVRDMCINLLPSFQIPTIIELVDEIEKNASGKIVRRKEKNK